MSKLVDKKQGNPFEMQIEEEKALIVEEQGKEASPENKPKKQWLSYLKRFLKYVFIDGMSGMAIGLFATLIIGTIVENIGKLFGGDFGKYVCIAGQFAKFMMGAGIALGMGYKLKKSPLVSVSAGVVDILAPAAICLLLSELMRKKGWIKYGDLKLDL